MREEEEIVLESDNMPSNISKRDEYSDGEVKKQKDWFDGSANYVLVFCHLEMLCHSLLAEPHMTQVYPNGCHMLAAFH